MVTLPKELVESKKIKEGEIVEITVKKVRKDGVGGFKGLTPFTAKDELTAHEEAVHYRRLRLDRILDWKQSRREG